MLKKFHFGTLDHDIINENEFEGYAGVVSIGDHENYQLSEHEKE